MMFDKMLNMGHSRFFSHEQNIKICFFLSTHPTMMKSLIVSLTKFYNFFIMKFSHIPISFLCSLLFSIWVVILALGFEILKK
jgi:hypothetical protein